MTLFTPIIALVLWVFLLLWLSANTILAWVAVLVGLGVVLALRAPSKMRLVAAAILAILAVTVTFRANALSHNNSPDGLVRQAWQVEHYNLYVEQRLSSSAVVAAVIEPADIKDARVLVTLKTDVELDSGCHLAGIFRAVPHVEGALSWMLKAQASPEISCDRLSDVATLRSSFSQALSGVTPDATALVAGLAIGDDSKLSLVSKRAMQTVSLTHLTAVSGANCVIVIGLVAMLLRRLPISRALRISLCAFALFGYVATVGMQPSVLRAATMTLVLMLCTFFGRPIRPMHSLSFAVIILLIADPFMATQIGFALSVAATFGLLTLTPMIFAKLRKRMPNWLAASFSVAAAAQVWCLPLLLELQGGIPTYSLIANALAEPMVALITVLGILALLIAPVWPAVASMLSWLASIPAAAILEIAGNLSRWNLATFWWPTGTQGALLLAGLALSVTCFALKKKAVGAIAAAVCVSWLTANVAFAAGAYSQWPVANWSIVNCNVGQGDALVLRSRNKVAVIDVGRADKPIDDCLARLGIREIELLVLTHFDLDHVGGITGALTNRSVDRALISDYDDGRSQATLFTDEIQSAAPVTRAHAGLRGVLGDIEWTVLQPDANGFGAEDSNDGSIAMRWDSPDFTLFTMADLGERGQMRLVQKYPSSAVVNHDRPVVLKVSHHGSADQYHELIESWNPDVALISVGRENPYGHPTKRTLGTLRRSGVRVFRTDLNGALSLAFDTSTQNVRVGLGG